MANKFKFFFPQKNHHHTQDVPIDTESLDYYKQKLSESNIKIKQLEDENASLKAQLLTLKSKSDGVNSSIDSSSMQIIEHTNLKINSLKEIDKYKSIISDLIKSNEEKEKKCDELTKQVIRFKRIQEIVLTAQINVNNSNQMIKNKSKLYLVPKKFFS